MHGWKVYHPYWKVMNHAMYTTQTRRGYFSICFLIEPWRIKEELATEENIPKTDTLCYCVLINSDGSDKQVPIVIGKFSNPRCFKDVKKLPVKYHANSKAWMTTEIFCSFLHSLDMQMGAQNRKIILFVDNCAAHPKDTPFLRNVRVVWYPANCTSALQPLTLGIIHSFKAYYTKRLMES
jgi:hypothetical protein